MADGSERRVARRFTMSLPLRVLPREARSSELRTQTRDVSYQGLYFLAEAQFEVGSEIEFVLTLPKQIAQSTEVDIRCRGQIVRVDSTPDGHVGVAAKIERYEFLPSAASAA
jgi:PilZ domain